MEEFPIIAAIILSAGKSERMGQPKALLPFRGRTFLENIIEAISLTKIQHTIVVVGHHQKEIESGVPSARFVFNPDYEQGMITSFQTGIRALPENTLGSFLFLVDHPIVVPGSVDALIAHATAGRIILPVFAGRRGHPVFFGSEVLEEVLALPPSQGANIVVRKDPDRVIEVPVDTPGILVDVDTPEDFERLRSQE